MQILVLSDSHRKTDSIPYLLNKYKNQVSTVIHLGDNIEDLLQFESDYSAINFVAVAGNCDFSINVPKERILTLGLKRVLLTHGHYLNVKAHLDRLIYYSLEREVDVCLFGHSHEPIVFSHESVFFMNPGSISEPRGRSKPSYGLLLIDGDKVLGEVLNI